MPRKLVNFDVDDFTNGHLVILVQESGYMKIAPYLRWLINAEWNRQHPKQAETPAAHAPQVNETCGAEEGNE